MAENALSSSPVAGRAFVEIRIPSVTNPPNIGRKRNPAFFRSRCEQPVNNSGANFRDTAKSPGFRAFQDPEKNLGTRPRDPCERLRSSFSPYSSGLRAKHRKLPQPTDYQTFSNLGEIPRRFSTRFGTTRSAARQSFPFPLKTTSIPRCRGRRSFPTFSSHEL